MRRSLIFIIFVITFLLLALLLSRETLVKYLFFPRDSQMQTGVRVGDFGGESEKNAEDLKVVVSNLNVPWDLVFLPQGDILLTERSGNLLRISLSGDKTLVQKVDGVEHVGEGGLLGITLHPDYSINNWIYLYLTTKLGGDLENRVERYVYRGGKLSDKEVVIDGIKGAQYHDGGKIEFGADGFLYITTGDVGNLDSAQRTDNLEGKILRVTDSGEPAPNNPYGNEVYSYGHRNPQGIAWDQSGKLWATEHGPSGINTGYDEVNEIVMGGNYGWPIIKGDQSREGMLSPLVQSGADDTWAPAGVSFWNGSLFFGGLRGEALYELKLPTGETDVEMVVHFKEEFGRIRAVKRGPDDFLYITTSNTDGRGGPNQNDDKLIRINPENFR